jgi:hypothetical protein
LTEDNSTLTKDQNFLSEKLNLLEKDYIVQKNQFFLQQEQLSNSNTVLQKKMDSLKDQNAELDCKLAAQLESENDRVESLTSDLSEQAQEIQS